MVGERDKLSELSGKVIGLDYKVDFITDELKELRADVNKIATAMNNIGDNVQAKPTTKKQAFQVSAAGIIAAVLVAFSEISGLKELLEKLAK